MYALKMGASERQILEQCRASRIPLPKAIREAPELDLGLEFAYSAFWQLNTCRPIGWGPGPIPWTHIVDYAGAYGLDAEDASEFIHLMRAMDSAYLEHVLSKPAEGKKPSGSA